MHDYTSELRAYIEEKKEEIRLPEQVQTIFKDMNELHDTKQRIHALDRTILVLKKENLFIDQTYIEHIDALQDTFFELKKTMHTHIDWLLSELTPKKWFSLIQLLENNRQKEQTALFLDVFASPQKETFYHLIRTTEHTKNEIVLLRPFEEKLRYDYAFLRAAQPVQTDEALRPFEQFFETYVSVYHQKTAATLRWLKNDVFTMHLTDTLLERYAQSAVRRLEIGEEIEDPKQKQQQIQTAVTEFKWLLQAQQQKKSSK